MLNCCRSSQIQLQRPINKVCKVFLRALIAFHNDLDVTINQKVCKNGRFIVLKCIIQDSPFLVINLSNTKNQGEQTTILKSISEAIENIVPDHSSAIIMGGDFNIIQDINLDSDGGFLKPKYSSISAIAQLQNSRDLTLFRPWGVKGFCP